MGQANVGPGLSMGGSAAVNLTVEAAVWWAVRAGFALGRWINSRTFRLARWWIEKQQKR